MNGNKPSTPNRNNRMEAKQIPDLTNALAANAESPSAPLVHTDEFLLGTTEGGEIGELGWNTSGGTFVAQAALVGRPGIVRRRANSNNTVTTLYLCPSANTANYHWGEFVRQLWIVSPLQDTANQQIRLGVTSAVNSLAPARCCMFGADQGDTNWHVYLRNGGLESKINTGVPFVPGNWYKLKMERKEQGQLVFSVNGSTLEVADNPNEPSADGGILTGMSITPRSGGNYDMLLDFFTETIQPPAR